MKALIVKPERTSAMLQTMSNKQLLDYLAVTSILEKRYGTWKVQWGDINRYQRPADGVTFSDSAPSLPVGLASRRRSDSCSRSKAALWIPKRYGYSGNSFIAAVEFGPRIKAKTIITGGQSFDPASKHFTDQAGMLLTVSLRTYCFIKTMYLNTPKEPTIRE